MIKGIPKHHLQDEEIEGLSGHQADEIVEEQEAEDLEDVEVEEEEIEEPIEEQIQNNVFEVNINPPTYREELPADTDSIVGMSVDDVMDSIFQHMEDDKAMLNQSSTNTIVTRQTSKFEAITDSEESSDDELEREQPSFAMEEDNDYTDSEGEEDAQPNIQNQTMKNFNQNKSLQQIEEVRPAQTPKVKAAQAAMEILSDSDSDVSVNDQDIEVGSDFTDSENGEEENKVEEEVENEEEQKEVSPVRNNPKIDEMINIGDGQIEYVEQQAADEMDPKVAILNIVTKKKVALKKAKKESTIAQDPSASINNLLNSMTAKVNKRKKV